MNIELCEIIDKYDYDKLNELVQSICKLSDMNSLEFEIGINNEKIIDEILQNYEDNFQKIDYSDEILYILESFDNHTYFRYNPKTHILERKDLLYKKNLNYSCIPIIFRFAREFTEKINNPIKLSPVRKYCRKQRISYRFDLPELYNWRIDKTVRFYTREISKKLNYPLTENNVGRNGFYDKFDLEFEYTGDPKNFDSELSVLLTYLFPKLFRYTDRNYGKIKQFLGRDPGNIFPKVSVITQSIINNSSIGDYYVSEKLDGERHTLILFENSIYDLSANQFSVLHKFQEQKSFLSEYGVKRNYSEIILLDGEKVDEHYYLFDIYIPGQIIMFDEKLSKIKEFIEKYSYSNKTQFIQIPYKKYNSWAEVIDFVNNNERSITFAKDNIVIDGLVLRKESLNKRSYGEITVELYKLKNSSHLTIDCLVKYNPDDEYCYLFLIGNPKCVITAEPFTNPITQKLLNYQLVEKMKENNVYILFDSPYKENNYKLKLNDYEKYDGKIVELLFSSGTNDNNINPIPIHIRTDKEYSNNYRVGLSILETIYNPVKQNNNSTNSRLAKIKSDNKSNLLRLYYPVQFGKTTTLFAMIMDSDCLFNTYNNHKSEISRIYITSINRSSITDFIGNVSRSMNECIVDIKALLVDKINHNDFLYNCSTKNKKQNKFSTAKIDYRELLKKFSENLKFNINSCNTVIIDDLFAFADSYLELFYLITVLRKILHPDGNILIITDTTTKNSGKKSSTKIAKQNNVKQNSVKPENIYDHINPFMDIQKNIDVVEQETVLLSLPDELSEYQEFYIKLFDQIDEIQKELIDPIYRYDRYINFFSRYFSVKQFVNENNLILTVLRTKN